MRPLGKIIYIDSPGTFIGNERERIYVKEKEEKVAYFNLHNLDALVINNRASISTSALETISDYQIPVIFYDWRGCYFGQFENAKPKNIFIRKSQVLAGNFEESVLQIAKFIVMQKISSMERSFTNCHLADYLRRVENCQDYEQLLGHEGSASREYFKFLKSELQKFNFDFHKREFYPPRDSVNALLSLAYSLLMTEVTLFIHIFGLDPAFGFLHRDYYGRDSLICDLMEPFRSSIADKFVLFAIKKLQISNEDFSMIEDRCLFSNDEKRKAFYRLFRTEFFDDDCRRNILNFVRDVYDMIIELGSDKHLVITRKENAA